MYYTVISETDGLGYSKNPVVPTLKEAAVYYRSAGDQVFVCEENGKTLRSLTEEEELELRNASGQFVSG